MVAGRLVAFRELDPAGEPAFAWLRPPDGFHDGDGVVLLLGAFDPPTLAHTALLEAARTRLGLPGAFCVTKVLLDRPPDGLLPVELRVELLDQLAAEMGAGLAACNRGTYLDVNRAARDQRIEPTFLIGSDKVAQLEDPAFYPSGARGVEETFEQARFLVVERAGVRVDRSDVEVLRAEDVFASTEIASLSASRVRALVRSGKPITGLVPPNVALAVRGYTVLAESR
jgi:nicotinic acid mononucleotide adenylyltransferase